MAEGILTKRGVAGGTDISDATATADQILEGVTAYIAAGKVTGVRPKATIMCSDMFNSFSVLSGLPVVLTVGMVIVV